jgi:hypothetical protein
MLSILEKLPTPSLSWKQKLTIVIAITLLGLILVTGSGFMGLNSVSQSFVQQKAASDYDTNSIILAGKLLQLKLASQDLTAENSENFSNALEALSNLVLDMQSMAKGLNYQELSAFSERLSRLVNTYVSGNKTLLDGRSIIGFTPNEGKLKGLYAAQTQLEENSFSMIEDDVVGMITGQKGYLITKSPTDKAKLEKGLANLETIVIDMSWESIKIGQSVNKYIIAYDAIKCLFD